MGIHIFYKGSILTSQHIDELLTDETIPGRCGIFLQYLLDVFPDCRSIGFLLLGSPG